MLAILNILCNIFQIDLFILFSNSKASLYNSVNVNKCKLKNLILIGSKFLVIPLVSVWYNLQCYN